MQNFSLAMAQFAVGIDDNLYYFQLLRSLSQALSFDIETPFNQLPKNIQEHYFIWQWR